MASITVDQAVEIARQHLIGRGLPMERRTVTTRTLGEAFLVVFSVPQDTLGGDFSVTVDAESGAILNETFER